MGKESRTVAKTPFPFANVRGTTEAGSAAVFLMGYREPDLSLRLKRFDLDLLEKFIRETGTKPEPQVKLTISRSGLPQNLTMMVLQPKPN